MLAKKIEEYLERNDFTKIHIKAILFDMDGVLFDSMPNHAIAWVKAMAESGMNYTEMDTYLNEGQPAADTINCFFEKKFGRNSTIEERKAIYRLKADYFDELQPPNPIPHIEQILKAAKQSNLKLYVVTGSAHFTLLNRIKTDFNNYFDDVITALDLERGKPHPDPYLEVLKRANLKPWEAFVVENAPLGVKSSSAAQIFTFGVNTGILDNQLLWENGADIVYDSMKDLYNDWNSIKNSLSF